MATRLICITPRRRFAGISEYGGYSGGDCCAVLAQAGDKGGVLSFSGGSGKVSTPGVLEGMF